jgi:type II secretory pathway predicted ATPase ExeA
MTIVERDPFSDTTDPAAYVPRIATESALVQLETALRDGARVVCLEGPAGSGKSMLLNVLEERVADEFRALRVPYPKLEPDEFCHWGLAALSGSSTGDPERALAERIGSGAASGEPPLVWIIDDADCLPVPTLRSLLWVQRSTGDALRLLLARSGELPAEELAQAGVRSVNVELDGEMESSEMAQYVRARLDRAKIDPARRAQIEAALEALYARSHGNPRRLHAAASVLLCFGLERLAALPEEERAAPAPSAASGARGADAAIAPGASLQMPEIPTSPSAGAERVSIESLVAEAVAAEQPIEELAIAEPSIAEPAHAEREIAPDPIPEPPVSAPPSGSPARPAPRKRHRLRRLGRH